MRCLLKCWFTAIELSKLSSLKAQKSASCQRAQAYKTDDKRTKKEQQTTITIIILQMSFFFMIAKNRIWHLDLHTAIGQLQSVNVLCIHGFGVFFRAHFICYQPQISIARMREQGAREKTSFELSAPHFVATSSSSSVIYSIKIHQITDTRRKPVCLFRM